MTLQNFGTTALLSAGGHSSHAQTCFAATLQFGFDIRRLQYRGNLHSRVGEPLKSICLPMEQIGVSSVPVEEKGRHVSVNIRYFLTINYHFHANTLDAHD
jgi:hypothetical protein